MGNVNSIKKVFALTITIAAFVIFSILGCISVYQFVNMTESNVRELLNTEAGSEADKLYGIFTAAANKAESLAQTFEAVNNYDAEVVSRIIKLYINEQPLLFGGGIWLEPFVFDAAHKYYAPYVHKTHNGDSLLTWGYNNPQYDYFRQEWYKVAFRSGVRAVWSRSHIESMTNQEILTCTSPIRRSGKVVGVATVDIAVQELIEYVKAIRVGKEGYAFVRDKNGLKIGEVGVQPSLENTGANSAIMSTAAPRQLIKTKIDNREVYSLDAPIGNTGLELVMVLPAQEFVLPLWRIIIYNVLLLVAAVLLFTMLILHLFEHKVASPLRRLSAATARIGIGDLDNAIKPEADDEIGRLAVSFELMRRKIASLLTKLNDKNSQLLSAYDVTIRAFYKAIEQRESNTAEHSLEVNAIAMEIGRKLGLKEDQLRHLNWGTLLHDLGKLAIDDSVLLKPGPLDDLEYMLIKKHPEVGYKILIESDFLRETAEVALYHQEKYDGTGYPYGLSGENIPLLARICSVADAFQAMIADRPYRMGMSHDEAVRELARCRGKHFDPQIVDVFLSLDLSQLKRRAV
jgi:methyl-accepting chemotaxis protein